MEVSSRENGLLKLVHPGRHVEYHRKPVMAAEIMRKYPRHCIARPDVFKFPWIVVRPESLLVPGKVFYLVPYHTMYNLLKAKGPLLQASIENKSPKYHYHQHGYSPTRLNAPAKRRCRHHPNEPCSCVLIQLRTCRNNQDSDDAWSDTSYAAAWTQINSKARELYIHSSEIPVTPRDSLLNASTPFPAKVLENCSSNFSSTLLRVGDSGKHARISGVNTALKSCLRKHDSLRDMLNLKVTFGSPIVLPKSSHESTGSR